MTPPPPTSEAAPAGRNRNRPAFHRDQSVTNVGRLWERGVEAVLFACAALSIVVMAAIFFVLFRDALTFFQDVSVVDFFTGTEWNPSSHFDPKYGVLPLINGTLMVTVGSAIIAVPLGLASAIYLSEFAHPRVRGILKPAIELLAGIPSIVFGLFAVLVISPLLKQWFDAQVFNAMNAVIVLAFMVLPIITTLAEDALRAVPQELRAGALALGATKWEVTRNVVAPAALSGIVAAILLGFSRAVGETMAVTLAAGAKPQWGLDFFSSIETMTAYITNIASGDIVQETTLYYSLFAVGLVLFLITFVINLIAAKILDRYREVY